MQIITKLMTKTLMADDSHIYVFYGCYFVDLTQFLLKHPGGSNILIENRNKDIKPLTDAIHEFVDIFAYIPGNCIWKVIN